jgi:hypothetical protein
MMLLLLQHDAAAAAAADAACVCPEGLVFEASQLTRQEGSTHTLHLLMLLLLLLHLAVAGATLPLPGIPLLILLLLLLSLLAICPEWLVFQGISVDEPGRHKPCGCCCVPLLANVAVAAAVLFAICPEWLVFEGISVDESGRQHYLDATVAYKRAVLNAIHYLAKFGYTPEQVTISEAASTPAM